MKQFAFNLLWRKTLIGLGVLVCLYAFGILCFVPLTPDIGIHCSFGPDITSVDDTYLQPANDQILPRPGDTILQVGNYPIESSQGKLWAQLQLQRKLLALKNEAPPVENPNGLRMEEGSRQVLVKFFSVREGKVAEVWCRLGSLPIGELVPSLLWFFLKAGLFVVGALVFWKRPGDASATQFFFLCIVTLGAYMGGYHWTRIASQPVLLLVFMACGVLLPAVYLHFFLVFPRPKSFLQRQPWWTLLGIYGLPLLFLAALLSSYGWFRWMNSRGASEDEVTAAWGMLSGLAKIYLKVAALWYLGSLVGLLHSFWTTDDVTERNQVKWIMYGAMLALVPICYTLYLIFWTSNNFGAGAAWAMFAASVCFTGAFAVSITRYRLMQLDQLVSSGAAYFLISFLAGVVYYAVVFLGMLGAGQIGSRGVGGPSFLETLRVSTTALVLMILLNLGRGRLKKALDRRFDRDKHQLDRTLRRMGQAIEQLVDPPTLARRLLQASAELLNVSQGAVYLRQGNPPLFRLAGCLDATPALTELSPGCPLVEALQAGAVVRVRIGFGMEDDPAQRQLRFLGGEVAHALAHEGQLLALLVLGPKDLGFYGTEDINLLAAFAQLTAQALESAERHITIEALNRDLRAKVEKIAEQQRRILALQSQLTRQAAPREAKPLLDEPAPEGLIGSSRPMRRLLDYVRKVAAAESMVLIRGESGTGKELLARALHDHSPRAGKPYVKVLCAALSPGLLESELFGHVKGAFTNAHRDKVGRFEVAHGGTLFLDEIGDISLELQTKLLRVLQEKTIERVGSSEPVHVDVRVLAATHQNLEELVRQGRFREDLYYRLKVIDLHVPPLRERREDIPELVLHFLEQYSRRSGKVVEQIDDDALALLKAHRWPGNVRELEHAIERAVVVAEGAVLMVTDLPVDLQQTSADLEDPARRWSKENGTPDMEALLDEEASRQERDRRERERLVRALAAAGGNKAEAARSLGLARSTLLSRLKKHGLS